MDSDEIVLDDAQENVDTPEKKVEETPNWASEMANTMRALADKVTAPTPAARPQLSPDQIREVNERLTKGIVEGNPLGSVGELANQISRENIDNFRQGLRPYITEAVDAFVDRYRSRMKEDAEDKGQMGLYRQVNKQFDRELEGEDLASLIEKPKAERDRVLNRAWKAAKGEVLGSRVVTKSVERPAGSSGSGGSSPGSGAKNTYTLSDVEKRQLYRSMKKEDAEKYIKEIEGVLASAGGGE